MQLFSNYPNNYLYFINTASNSLFSVHSVDLIDWSSLFHLQCHTCFLSHCHTRSLPVIIACKHFSCDRVKIILFKDLYVSILFRRSLIFPFVFEWSTIALDPLFATRLIASGLLWSSSHDMSKLSMVQSLISLSALHRSSRRMELFFDNMWKT